MIKHCIILLNIVKYNDNLDFQPIRISLNIFKLLHSFFQFILVKRLEGN